MREHHPEQNERATARTANAADQSVDTSNQMLPIPRAFDGVDHLRMKAALDTLAHQAGPEATGMKRVSNRLKKDDDEEEAILLAQAPADTSNHNNAPPSEKAISVVSEAAFNPECTATTADGCGVAVGAAGKSVGIAPLLLLPLLALGGGGSSEPPPKLTFTSGFGSSAADRNLKLNVTNKSPAEGTSDFNTNKDNVAGLTVKYELVSPSSDKLRGATIDENTGVFSFTKFDDVCIGDVIEFTVKATTFKDGIEQESIFRSFSVEAIGPESSINAVESNAHVNGPILSGGSDLDALVLDFLGIGPVLTKENMLYFGLEDTGILCIRTNEKYVELNTNTIEYIFFGTTQEYNAGDPLAYRGSLFGYELDEIYKLNQAYALEGSTLAVDGSSVVCNQLIYGAWTEMQSVTSTFLTGGSGDDLIFGSETGFNELIGGDGDDFIIAISRGGNVLNGGKGSDVLIGSTGSDTFVFSSSEFGKDRILADDLDVFEIDGLEYKWDPSSETWKSEESESESYISYNQLGYFLDGDPRLLIAEAITFPI